MEVSSPGRVGRFVPKDTQELPLSMKSPSPLLGAFLLFLSRSNLTGYCNIHLFLHNEKTSRGNERKTSIHWIGNSTYHFHLVSIVPWPCPGAMEEGKSYVRLCNLKTVCARVSGCLCVCVGVFEELYCSKGKIEVVKENNELSLLRIFCL